MLVAAILAAATITRARYLMGTVCEITAPPAAVEPAFAEAARIESVLSTWRPESELSKLNGAARTSAMPELVELLHTVVDRSRETGGAFNPLVRPLIDAWKIRESGFLPDAETLRAALRRMDLGDITFDHAAVELSNGALVEEGGFGKGYALDRMMAVIAATDGGASPDIVINFGGQIAVRGEHVVSIADPAHRDRPLVTLSIRDASLSTSSGSEKTFTIAGRRFSHIVDPRTGEALPPRGSVSVIDRSALRADILSTALYVMGRDAGLRWAREHGVHAIFISESGEIEETK